MIVRSKSSTMGYPENIGSNVWKIFSIFISLSYVAQGKDPSLRCYNDTTGPYKVFTIDNITEVIKYCSNYAKLSCYAYGFSQKTDSPQVQSVVDTLRAKADSCVCLLDYEDQANSYLNYILPPNVQTVGVNYGLSVFLAIEVVSKFVAQIFCKLYKAGLHLSIVHWFGHSLGCHVLGVAGKELRNCTGGAGVGRLSGYDCAGPLFEGPITTSADWPGRAGRESADYVDAHHTDQYKYGIKDCIGHADIWYNLAAYIACFNHQPSCPTLAVPLTPPDFCSHNFALSVLKAEVTNDTALLACSADQKTQTYLGENIDKTYRGSLFVCSNNKANADGTVDVIDAPKCCTDSSASQDPCAP